MRAQNTESLEMQNNTIQGYRLSPQQQRQWVLQQHSERSPYLVQVQVLIEGNVDSEVLLKALFAVISRHEILNTTFQHLPGMSLPVQVINEPQVPVTSDLRLESSELLSAGDGDQRSISASPGAAV